MKKIIDFFKNHYGKIFAGTTGTIIFTVGGFFFSDARYAHSKEFDIYKKQTEERILNLEKKLENKD